LKTNDTINENFTIERLQKGSLEAFEILFNTYNQKVYRFSLSYLKSESGAQDIVQEVFLKIWENRAKIHTGTSFQSYLFTIAFNSIKKEFNKKAKEELFKSELFELFSTEGIPIDSHPNFEALYLKLDELISQMPERRKQIFLKRKKEGKSIHAIAEEMNISIKTVENQITESMHFLKKEFSNGTLDATILFFCFQN
jgi:RNA polymerase sigma-70 factor (ECF subfamily)